MTICGGSGRSARLSGTKCQKCSSTSKLTGFGSKGKSKYWLCPEHLKVDNKP